MHLLVSEYRRYQNVQCNDKNYKLYSFILKDICVVT